ncbi:TonB-dependent receptor [Solimonas terrae]|nr:TonB-dependent receptor [Solimonas terrae]
MIETRKPHLPAALLAILLFVAPAAARAQDAHATAASNPTTETSPTTESTGTSAAPSVQQTDQAADQAAEPSPAATAGDEPLPVIALPADPPPAVASTSSDAPQPIAEVIVTATKRAEPVRNIPATIAVLKGADLEREGVQDIDQIVTRVPGVNLTDDGQGQAKRVTIRGISADVNANFTTGTLLGDIPFSDPFVPKVQLDPNPFDMATVEVLKGPQGTLFGGSGLNGLIRYVPEAPQFDGFHAKYYTQYSAYPGNGGDGWSYGAMVNAPFADDTAAVRLMGFHRQAPGFIDNSFTGERDVNSLTQYGLRGIVAWKPSEDWKISLLGTTQKTTQDDVAFADNRDGKLQRGNTPRPSPSESIYSLGNIAVEGSLPWADLVSQTSVFKKQFDVFIDSSRIALGGHVPLLSAVDHSQSHGFSQELRLLSAPSDSPWKWLVGAFYFDTRLKDCAEAGAAEDLPGLPVPSVLEGLLANPCPGNANKLQGSLDIAQLLGDVDVREEALFGELTRALGDDWDVTVGARGYRTKSGGTVSTAGLLYSAQNAGFPAHHDADVSENGLSPKASVVFHPTRDFRTYFTVSRGFRFGGPQLGASTPTTNVPAVYKSDSLWNYELGLRSDWLDRSLRLDASAYFIDWKNPQVAQISNDSLVTFIDNVGGVKGRGVDLSLRYAPPFLRGLSLETMVAFNRTETTASFDSASGQTIPPGSRWPLSPHWQTSTTLAYAFPVDDWLLGASLRHTYISKACNTIECTAQVFGYRTLDLNLFVNGPDGSFWPQLSLSLNNLTDERGYSNITISPTLGESVNYIAPRAIVLRLGGNF